VFVIRIIIVIGLVLLFSSAAKAFDTKGVWQQGGVIQGRVTQGTQVQFLKHDVRVDKDGLFVIGLGRDAEPEAIITTINAAGEKIKHTFAVAQREYRIQKVNGVPKKTVNPSKEQVARSRKEGALVWHARQLDSERKDFSAQFQWPLIGPVTGVYGSQRFYNGTPGRPHFGVDVAAPTGTLVVAPVSGVVTLVHNDMFFSGGTLIVDHGHGLSSTFIHLSKILVEKGQALKVGDPIAEVGASGRATGPHLDWRMNWFEQRVDPQLLVGAMPKKIEK
tara:strand:- start:1475 stop:2302 length:828 start_codon:yes stop_codon:yes gene_type:complete